MILQNTVELLGYYGGDEAIALSAWTSTSRELTEEKRARIPALLARLWREGHETPFEKGIVHFLVNTDIATHIHILKHRISSANAESARYKELKEDKIYIPSDWPLEWQEKLVEHSNKSNELYHSAIANLESILGRKRAKESARYFKTYSSQIAMDVSFNIRSFANFYRLRAHDTAQVEVREIAEEMMRLIQESGAFRYTLEAIKNCLTTN